MKKIVIDSSVSLAWAFADEGNAYTDSVLSELKESQMLIPPLGFLELINAMYIGIKRQRINQNDASTFLDFIEELSTEKDISIKSSSFLSICQKYDLTAYDASFLLLAEMESCALATQDKQLKRAAQEANIKVF